MSTCPFKVLSGFARDLWGDNLIWWLRNITLAPDCQDSNPTPAIYQPGTWLSRSTSPCLNFFIYKIFKNSIYFTGFLWRLNELTCVTNIRKVNKLLKTFLPRVSAWECDLLLPTHVSQKFCGRTWGINFYLGLAGVGEKE